MLFADFPIANRCKIWYIKGKWFGFGLLYCTKSSTLWGAALFVLVSFSEATTPSFAGESKKDYIMKRPSGIMKVRSANCTRKTPGGLLRWKRYSEFAAHNVEMPVSCSVCSQIPQNGNIWANQNGYRSDSEKIVRAKRSGNHSGRSLPGSYPHAN